MAREELNKDQDNRATRLRQEAAQKNLDYIYLHPDYVTQQNIVFSLAGKEMEARDKKIIATKIWQQLQEVGGKVENFPFNPEILKKLEINTIWPEDEQWPDLSKFVGHYSLVLFFHLKMANERSLSWIT